MMWGKKKINGTVYDLTHLDPFILNVPRSGVLDDYRVLVEFGSHTFTEAFTPLHNRDLAISDGKDLRAFCLKRHGYSQTLPAAIRAAVSGVACFDHGRMLISGALPGLAGPYLIAFKLRAKKTSRFDAVMTIVSAHHRPNLDPNLLCAPFKAAISATIQGRKIDWKKK